MRNPNHECDLFLMSSHRAYRADRALTEFAQRGSRNIHGWGIGSFAQDRPLILKSALSAATAGNLSNEFAVAIQAVSSPVIVGHLRFTSRGATRQENNHPFSLPIEGSDWLLIHNGSATRHRELVPHDERLLTEADSDTPRIFEFIRKRVIEYLANDYRKSLIEAFRHAYQDLLEQDPDGSFNLIISNGLISFAFVHWRPFFLLHREKEAGDAILLSTLKLTDREEWREFRPKAGRKAKMLVIAGANLIFNGDIPK